MRVLVTFAVEAEFAPWRRLATVRSSPAGGCELLQTRIGSASVDFVVTGMGMNNARKGAEAAMSVPHTICIAAGFAGSLKRSYKVGDILVARAVRRIGKPKTIESARSLFMAACENRALEAEMFLTSDGVVGTAEEKARLQPFADAVDMESFATLSVASERKLPAVAIRVISDRFDEHIPANIDTTIGENGRIKIAGVVKHIARHPFEIPALLRLGRQSRISAEALAHFLEAFIKDLSFRGHGWPPRELQEVLAR